MVIADDLSGAAEVAASLGRATPVTLWPDGLATFPTGDTVVLDSDTRALPARDASVRLRAIVDRLDPAHPVVVKADSLLRGRFAAVVEALVRAERVVVVAPALPSLGRTTVDGGVLVGGVPLPQTDAWAVEAVPPPRSIAAALGGQPWVNIGLAAVRGGGLAEELQRTRGRVAICDAETTADLAAIATAAQHVLPAAAVGASALCRAFFPGAGPASTARTRSPRPCLVVVGTAIPDVADQVALLVHDTGAADVGFSSREMVACDPAQLAERGRDLDAALAHGDVVVHFSDRPDGPARIEPAAALAALVSQCGRVRSGAADIILTGGQTARSVLDGLGVRSFTVVAEVAPGAIISELPYGALLGTRPGSFGGLASLLDLRLAIGPAHQQSRRNLP